MKQHLPHQFHHHLWMVPFILFFGTYLFLHVWFKAETINTPYLIGSNLKQAAKICSDVHIYPQIIQTYIDADMPDATIMHQTPAAESTIKKGQVVYIAISQKPPRKIAPNYVGLSREDIKMLAKQNDLRVKCHAVAYPYPEDHCFCQWPTPGAPLASKTIICYVAKKEPRLFIFPDVTKKTLTEVISYFQANGMNVQTNPIAQQTEDYFITSQQPKAGAIIQQNELEQLTVHLNIKPLARKQSSS